MSTGETHEIKVELPSMMATTRGEYPDHDPTPVVQLVDKPDGLGQVGIVKKGEHHWEVVQLDGPNESVARHMFRSLDSLVAWLKAFGAKPDRAQIFFDQKAQKIAAKLDPGDPTGDRVDCEVLYAPAFKAWVVDAAGKVLGQRGFFSLIRGHGGVLNGDQAEVLLGKLGTLRILGNQQLECELAANGRTIVSGMRGGVEMSSELPGEIHLELPIYQGVPHTYPLAGILDVEASPEGLAVKISFPELDEVLAQAGIGLVEHVQRNLGEPWLVCLGVHGDAAVQKREGVTRIARQE